MIKYMQQLAVRKREADMLSVDWVKGQLAKMIESGTGGDRFRVTAANIALRWANDGWRNRRFGRKQGGNVKEEDLAESREGVEEEEIGFSVSGE